MLMEDGYVKLSQRYLEVPFSSHALGPCPYCPEPFDINSMCPCPVE